MEVVKFLHQHGWINCASLIFDSKGLATNHLYFAIVFFFSEQVLSGGCAGLLRRDGGGSHSASKKIVFMAREPSPGTARLTTHRPHASTWGKSSRIVGKHGTEIWSVDVDSPWRQTVYCVYIP